MTLPTTSGEGRLEFASGDVYDGFWLADQRHGYGKFVSVATGQTVVYEGMWKNGVKNGMGKMTLAGGESSDPERVSGD